MIVHFFDVEHGECNAVETPTGEIILIGIGHNSSTGWRPSTWLRQKKARPSWIVLTNLDSDHLSDLANFEPYLRPDVIKFNNNIDPNWLERKKLAESGIVHDGVATAIHWMRGVFTGIQVTHDHGIEKLFFQLSPWQFQDTNNLSVVTFIKYANCGILFPGDLEQAGWLEFLKNPAFVDVLRQTNIFVASHHGRIGGYCEDVFNYCSPDVVIISDKERMHDTQEHDSYSKHCRGIDFGGTIRRVLTTRNDGKMTLVVPPSGPYTLYIEQSY